MVLLGTMRYKDRSPIVVYDQTIRIVEVVVWCLRDLDKYLENGFEIRSIVLDINGYTAILEKRCDL